MTFDDFLRFNKKVYEDRVMNERDFLISFLTLRVPDEESFHKACAFFESSLGEVFNDLNFDFKPKRYMNLGKSKRKKKDKILQKDVLITKKPPERKRQSPEEFLFNSLHNVPSVCGEMFCTSYLSSVKTFYNFHFLGKNTQQVLHLLKDTKNCFITYNFEITRIVLRAENESLKSMTSIEKEHEEFLKIQTLSEKTHGHKRNVECLKRKILSTKEYNSLKKGICLITTLGRKDTKKSIRIASNVKETYIETEFRKKNTENLTNLFKNQKFCEFNIKLTTLFMEALNSLVDTELTKPFHILLKDKRIPKIEDFSINFEEFILFSRKKAQRRLELEAIYNGKTVPFTSFLFFYSEVVWKSNSFELALLWVFWFKLLTKIKDLLSFEDFIVFYENQIQSAWEEEIPSNGLAFPKISITMNELLDTLQIKKQYIPQTRKRIIDILELFQIKEAVYTFNDGLTRKVLGYKLIAGLLIPNQDNEKILFSLSSFFFLISGPHQTRLSSKSPLYFQESFFMEYLKKSVQNQFLFRDDINHIKVLTFLCYMFQEKKNDLDIFNFHSFAVRKRDRRSFAEKLFIQLEFLKEKNCIKSWSFYTFNHSASFYKDFKHNRINFMTFIETSSFSQTDLNKSFFRFIYYEK